MVESARQTFIGVDIGGTNLRLALLDRSGEVLDRLQFPTSIGLGREPFLDRLFGGINSLLKKSLILGGAAAGVGIGLPGLVSPDGMLLSSVNLPVLVGLNLRELAQARTGLPVALVNDANAIAYGEKAFGAGKGFGSFLMLTLGTGVGSGLVLGGKLWIGIDGLAGEYGHATVEPDGLPCLCGNRGCLEQYASATAVAEAARAALERSADGMLAQFPLSAITAESVAVAALKGDRLACSIFERAGRYIGIAVASAANLLNLEAVIIGGGLAGSFDLLAGAVRREIDTRSFPPIARRVAVVRGALGDDAGIVGSAAMAMELS